MSNANEVTSYGPPAVGDYVVATKYFVDLGDGEIFEINATSEEEAISKIKCYFRGRGEVRLIINVYRHLHSTPYMIKT